MLQSLTTLARTKCNQASYDASVVLVYDYLCRSLVNLGFCYFLYTRICKYGCCRADGICAKGIRGVDNGADERRYSQVFSYVGEIDVTDSFVHSFIFTFYFTPLPSNVILISQPAGELDPNRAEVSAFIEEHRERFGVEPICHTLGVSVSAYYERASGRRSPRQIEDVRLLDRIREVHEANYCAYGYRRTWKALLRASEEVGRDRVRRLAPWIPCRRIRRRLGGAPRLATLTRRPRDLGVGRLSGGVHRAAGVLQQGSIDIDRLDRSGCHTPRLPASPAPGDSRRGASRLL